MRIFRRRAGTSGPKKLFWNRTPRAFEKPRPKFGYVLEEPGRRNYEGKTQDLNPEREQPTG
jgi:hypothetical protein